MGRQRKPPRYWQSRLQDNRTAKQPPSCIRNGDNNGAAVQGEIGAGPITPVCLATEIERTDGSITSEVRRVSSEEIKQAQDIIARAVNADEVAQRKAIDDAILTLYPYCAKPGQREVLHSLIYLREDLILIAGTGFGKSMILQAVSVLLRKSMTIIILPLDQIGDEQSEYIRQIGGIPCFLNRDTISPNLLDKVHQGSFTHILISPELAISDSFRPVASSPSFKQCVSLVVVDEAHLVYHWGRDFRTAYSRLNLLRGWLGSQIPWFACSATLDLQTLESLRKGISFEENVKVQRSSIDRPELLFRIGWIPRGAGFKALQFLFTADEINEESLYKQLNQIPKTIIFFNTRKGAHTAADECLNWLCEIGSQHYTPHQVEQALKVFHRNTASVDKRLFWLNLRKRAFNLKSVLSLPPKLLAWVWTFQTFGEPPNGTSP
jgi:DEAD/DEAH box helicase